MSLEFGLVLGYDGLGAVTQCVQAVKAANLIPLLVLNRTAPDYTDLVPPDLVLKSENVNHDHAELAREIEATIGSYSGNLVGRVRIILNVQDRMWICYLDLRNAFPTAVGIDPQAIVRTTIKPNLRFLLRETKFRVEYALLKRGPSDQFDVTPGGPLHALYDAVAGDLVVKPVVGMAGLGVSRIRRGNRKRFAQRMQEAAGKALATQREAYHDSVLINYLEFSKKPYQPINDYILVEEYLDGQGYSMEGFSNTGGRFVHLVEQLKTNTVEDPNFRDLGYVAGHSCSPNSQNVECVAELLKLVGLETFAFHIELKNGGAAKPVEFNPRPGGGSIVELVRVMHQSDILQLGLGNILQKVAKKRYLATAVLQPSNAGKLIKYIGLEAASAQPDCVFVKMLVREGTIITRTDMEVYLMELCVVAGTRTGAQKRAAHLASSITVLIE